MDYGAGLKLGETTVSFHPAGHILGSAQIRVRHDSGETWLATGDYKRDPDPTCDPFEVVPCDTLITEATFALPVYRWRPTPELAREVLTWWNDCIARGREAVLFCYALGKAQRLLAELAPLTDRTVFLHGAMLELVQVYREAGIAMLPTAAVSEQAKGREFAGQLILAPTRVRAWRSERAQLTVQVVKGNHDRHFDARALGIDVLDEPWHEAPFAFARHPEPHTDAYTLAGHLHPGVELSGAHERRARLPAFRFAGDVGLIPAFGSLSGLWTEPPRREERVFVVAGGAVIHLPDPLP